MRIGTTPTHIFELSPDIAATVAKARVIYAQSDNIVLTKEIEQLEGINVVCKLTQEETLKFSQDSFVKIQLRALTLDGDALTSDVITVPVLACLEKEVFK